jgi:hypothetical protein
MLLCARSPANSPQSSLDFWTRSHDMQANSARPHCRCSGPIRDDMQASSARAALHSLRAGSLHRARPKQTAQLGDGVCFPTHPQNTDHGAGKPRT